MGPRNEQILDYTRPRCGAVPPLRASARLPSLEEIRGILEPLLTSPNFFFFFFNLDTIFHLKLIANLQSKYKILFYIKSHAIG